MSGETIARVAGRDTIARVQIFRVIVRGRFGTLDDEQRTTLRRRARP